MKVKYLIGIGLEKCGTTSIYELLRNTPGFLTTRQKESYHFNRGDPTGVGGGFQQHFPRLPAPSEVQVDITPSYFRHPETPGRIQEQLGSEVAVFLILRHPLQRAFSHYWHHLIRHITRGEAEAAGFQAFVDCSFQAYVREHSSLLFPMYSPTVASWQAAFGERLGVFWMEDLIQDLAPFHKWIQAQTGISSHKPVLPHRNASQAARLGSLGDLLIRWDLRSWPPLYWKERLQREHALAIQETFTHRLPQSVCEAVHQQFYAEDLNLLEPLLQKTLQRFHRQHTLTFSLPLWLRWL